MSPIRMKNPETAPGPSPIPTHTFRRPTAVLYLLLAAGVAGLGLRAFGQTGSKPPAPVEEIRAQRFVLVDAQNRKLASLARGDDGRPALVLWNAEETAAASIGIDKNGMPRVVLESGGGDVSMGFIDAASPVFAMRDARQKRRITATVFGDQASINLYDDQQRERWMVGVNAKGQPVARVKDEDGNLRAAFALDESGVGLTLSSEDEKTSVALQVHPQGQGDVGILRENGKRGVALQTGPDGNGTVAIFEDKLPVWQARKP